MARRKRTEPAPPEGAMEHQLPCRHHWVIETPHGPLSRGVCRLCGVVREFKNFWDDVAGGDVPWRERLETTQSLKP